MQLTCERLAVSVQELLMTQRLAVRTRQATALVAAALVLAACGGGGHSEAQRPTAAASPSVGSSKFFVKADFDRQLAQEKATPEGPADKPWLQAIDPAWQDTSKFAKPGPWKFCLSNADFTNPWRLTGYTTMRAEVK